MKTPTHIAIELLTDGPRVTDHTSKASALRTAKASRLAGVDAYVHSVAFAAKFKLDPRTA